MTMRIPVKFVVAIAVLLTTGACAVNPVTGKTEMFGLSGEQEIGRAHV